MRDKVFISVAWATIFAAAFIMILMAYWAFYPYNIIDFELPIPIKNENNQVVRGETLYLSTTFDKHLQVNGAGESVIVCEDGNLVTVLPPRAVGVQFPLGRHTLEFDMKVPDKTSLGICQFKSVINYEVNPIREIPIEIYTEDFEVIE